jgi:lipoprotein NlpI
MIAGLRGTQWSCLTIAALVVAGFGVASQAPADERPWQRARCHDLFSHDDDQRIADCTALIQSGSEGPAELAADHFFRGFTYTNKRDYQRAIADYTETLRLEPRHLLSYGYRADAYYANKDYDRAIADYTAAFEIDPKLVTSLTLRGNVHADRGQFERAIADETQAIGINPKFPRAYFLRGLANLYGGSLPKARADLVQAGALDPKDAYAALWLDILDKRSNLPSRLAAATRQIDMYKWPAPIVRLFLGQLKPDALLAAADNANADHKKEQVCQADFYRGELALQGGATEEATRFFQVAATDCPITRAVPEQWAARAELKALDARR